MKQSIIIIIACVMSISVGRAEQPNLQLITTGGVNTGWVRYDVNEPESYSTFGFNVGLGLRVSIKRIYYRFDLAFKRTSFTLPSNIAQSLDLGIEISEPVVYNNAFNMPVVVGGYILKYPIFKWSAYGGVALSTSVKARVFNENGDEVQSLKAKDLGFRNPQLAARAGTAFDIAFFGIDFSYQAGLLNSLKTDYRAQTHEFEVRVAIIY